jgi:hypothetical protein
MRIRNLTVSNSRLTEGEYYPFSIIKKMEMGKESYFVMQDPMGYKILMPASFYTLYGFEPGQTITCRVDKINCNGRMFLEPMHPFYKEGEVYEFKVTDKGFRINILDEPEYCITVNDVFDQEWTVKVNSEQAIEHATGKIRCRLERIKKGRLFLCHESDKSLHAGLVSGRSYPFTVIDERLNPQDNLAYFVLKDQQGNQHLLKKKYYTHYGLKKGLEIVCRVDKFTSDGYFFLEPENPWYKEGEVYEFKILELQKLNFSDGSLQNVLVLEDPYSEEIKVFIEPCQVEQLKESETVLCRINKIRKSRIEPGII